MRLLTAAEAKRVVLTSIFRHLLPPMQQINLGMIGGGTVGSGVVHHLHQNGALIASRLGVKVAMRKVAVKAFDEPRPYEIPQSVMTLDWQEAVNDPQIHVVIELVGGTTIAKTITLAAL